MPKSSSIFTVTRREPMLVAPAKPTPNSLMPLSDIDDQGFLRFLVPAMLFYSGVVNGVDTRDPVKVIREALAEALVYYYPFAGRLRGGPRRKLVVDCTGEGVVFVEAEADFTLEDLSRESGFLRPPFPRELLCDVPGSSGILNCPLLLIQVTRFRCGGFLFAIRWNHTMSDAVGAVQFMKALAELARGASQPSQLPVWSRDLLLARDPPRVSCTHREYDQVDGNVFPIQYAEERVIERSFFFGPTEISAIRRHLPSHLKRCSTFELLSAFLWRCRTIAIRYDPGEEVRYLCLVDMRQKLKPPLPSGYYGNSFVPPAAVSTAGELVDNGLDYAVELIKKVRAKATEEYARSVTDFLATHGRPIIPLHGSWLASDNTKAGFMGIDLGWGKPVYCGPSSALVGVVLGPIGFFVAGKNGKGERGVLILICLPESAMERFTTEVECVGGMVDVNSKL